jgi:acyl-CoA reductase-like NAD-dependent aldehyde dehydrogenase
MRLLSDFVRDAGLPEFLFQVLGEDPGEAAAAIDAGVDHVVLTGSAPTGQAVLAKLAPQVTSATLELSGSDAVFVLPGADLTMVADALVFGLQFNGGASCIAPRRVFVPQALIPDLERHLAARISSAPGIAISPAVRERIAPVLQRAREEGARFLPEYPSLQKGMLRPTAVLHPDPASSLFREDLFAPLLALVAVRDMQEALQLDEECPFALGASIFGPETAAREMAAQINAGSIVINDLIVPTADPRLSFGGRGLSGFGVTRGGEGLLELTNIKTVSLRRGRFRPHFAPPDADQLEIACAYLRLAHGAGGMERIRSAIRLISALARTARRSRKS